MVKLLSVALLAAAVSASPVSATIFTSGSLTDASPTFHRPIPVGAPFLPTVLSGIGTAVHYAAFTFSVATSGSYDFLSTANFYNVLGLYSGPFDPTSPFVNVVDYNIYFGIFPGQAGFTQSLTAGTNYSAVIAGDENESLGDYDLSIDLVTASIPEPASWALMIGGFGLVGVAARRRRSIVVLSA